MATSLARLPPSAHFHAHIHTLRFGNGADVMNTIICDSRQLSAKKFAFFVKNRCFDEILQKLAEQSFSKTAIFFSQFFGENIL
jgi:hypothetical protein